MNDAKALRKAVAPFSDETHEARLVVMGQGASCPLGVSTDVAHPGSQQAH